MKCQSSPQMKLTPKKKSNKLYNTINQYVSSTKITWKWICWKIPKRKN